MSTPELDDLTERVTDIRLSGDGGAYYTLNMQTRGSDERIPVTVKHSKHSTFACMTCRSADACEHARLVARYVIAHGDVRESPF